MIEKIDENLIRKLIKDNFSDSYLYISAIEPELESVSNSFYGRNVYFKIKPKNGNYSILCSCEDSNQEVQMNTTPSCPYCGAVLRGNWDSSKRFLISTKNAAKIKKENEDKIPNNYHIRFSPITTSYYDVCYAAKTSEVLFQTYYVRKKPDSEIGIDIVRYTLSIVSNDGQLEKVEKYDNFAEIIPGSTVRAYKLTKTKGEEEIDFFDAFHITSDNIYTDESIYFEGAVSMIDFMAKNIEFSNRTGFTEILKSCHSDIPENSLFLLYMYLYSEYPVIELLAKMGYYNLIFGLIKDICQSYKRSDIRAKVEKLGDLLNQTTKGSAALAIPKYIGEFLNAKNAGIEEYMTWVSLNEYCPISKENFEAIISHEAYFYLNLYNKFVRIPDIIKYGYTIQQVFKYLIKQYQKTEQIKVSSDSAYGRNYSSFSSLVECWKDYLQMCEIMGIEAVKFPQDVIKMHNDIIAAKVEMDNLERDKKLALIADQYGDYKTTSKYLDVVVPRSINDFITEGNNNHNCVGSYASRVESGTCRIFFIRRKDYIEKSYITAECRQNGELGQCYYRNNQVVTDYTEIEFAKAFCKYIMQKGWEPKECEADS